MVSDWILRRLDESGFIDGLAKTCPAKQRLRPALSRYR
jgi:hypothetical protein